MAERSAVTGSRFGRRPLGANIGGVAAQWITRRLAHTAQEAACHFEMAGNPDVAEAIREAMADLQEAARQWRHAQMVTGPGSPEALPVEVGAEFPVAALPREVPAGLDVRAAAEVLGVSPRRVRQLCAAGRLTASYDRAGRWQIDPEHLDHYQADRTLNR